VSAVTKKRSITSGLRQQPEDETAQSARVRPSATERSGSIGADTTGDGRGALVQMISGTRSEMILGRLHIQTINGVQIWEGRCEDCGMFGNMVWHPTERKYLCIDCLQKVLDKESTAQSVGRFSHTLISR
jgi:hypothetical protein